MGETDTDEIARVYENGEHVADLVSERLVHEFDESPTYEVELLEETKVVA